MNSPNPGRRRGRSSDRGSGVRHGLAVGSAGRDGLLDGLAVRNHQDLSVASRPRDVGAYDTPSRPVGHEIIAVMWHPTGWRSRRPTRRCRAAAGPLPPDVLHVLMIASLEHQPEVDASVFAHARTARSASVTFVRRGLSQKQTLVCTGGGDDLLCVQAVGGWRCRRRRPASCATAPRSRLGFERLRAVTPRAILCALCVGSRHRSACYSAEPPWPGYLTAGDVAEADETQPSMSLTAASPQGRPRYRSALSNARYTLLSELDLR